MNNNAKEPPKPLPTSRRRTVVTSASITTPAMLRRTESGIMRITQNNGANFQTITRMPMASFKPVQITVKKELSVQKSIEAAQTVHQSEPVTLLERKGSEMQKLSSNSQPLSTQGQQSITNSVMISTSSNEGTGVNSSNLQDGLKSSVIASANLQRGASITPISLIPNHTTCVPAIMHEKMMQAKDQQAQVHLMVSQTKIKDLEKKLQEAEKQLHAEKLKNELLCKIQKANGLERRRREKLDGLGIELEVDRSNHGHGPCVPEYTFRRTVKGLESERDEAEKMADLCLNAIEKAMKKDETSGQAEHDSEEEDSTDSEMSEDEDTTQTVPSNYELATPEEARTQAGYNPLSSIPRYVPLHHLTITEEDGSMTPEDLGEVETFTPMQRSTAFMEELVMQEQEESMGYIHMNNE